jgi:hypothetical protein
MAKTIPQLTDATTVNAADELIIQQGGITKRATGAELAKGLNAINGTINVKDFGAVGDGVADDTAAINAAVAHAASAGRRIAFPFAATIRVPEDAPTLQAAINAIYPDPTVGFLLTIRISAGHQIASGFVVQNGDYGNIQITSQDATVGAASGFVGVNAGDSFSVDSLMHADNCTAPQWNLLVDMNNYGGGLVYVRSRGLIGNGCGVVDSSEYGLYAKQQSSVVAANANFSESNYGNRVTVNSFLNAPQCNFSNTKSATYPAGESNAAANLDVSRGSVVYITGALGALTNLTGGSGSGLAVRRSFVSATLVDCSGVAQTGLAAEIGSHVAFNNSVANNCGANGVFCSDSFVAFSNGTATGSATNNIQCQNGGTVTARNCVLTGATGSGVRVAQGGLVVIPNANCRKDPSIDQNTDISITEGSYVSASGATGGTSHAPMSFNGAGIIIKAHNVAKVFTTAGNAASSSVDLDVQTTSEDAIVRVFRGTSTTGARELIVYRGDGTSSVDAQIGSGGSNNYFINPTAIGTNTIDPRAILTLSSVTRGFLPPRMTGAQRDDISSVPAGLIVFNTTTNKINVYNGSAWESVTSA